METLSYDLSMTKKKKRMRGWEHTTHPLARATTSDDLLAFINMKEAKN
jgi:hypothetical protein